MQRSSTPSFAVRPGTALTLERLCTWVNAFSDFVKALDEDDSVQRLHHLIAEQGRALGRLDMTAVMVADVANRQLLVAASSGLSEDYVTRLQTETPLLVEPVGVPEPSPSVLAYRTRQMVFSPDIDESPGMQPWRAMAMREGYRSLIALPLDEGDRISGVLVGYSTERRRLTAEQIDILNLFAAHAGTALRAARLRDGLRCTIKELHEANQALSKQRRRLQRADRNHRRLMQVMANNVGVAGVVTMLAELLEASVTLDDANGSVITSAAHNGAYISPPRGSQRQAPEVREALDRIEHQRAGSVELDRTTGGRARLWVAPVTLSEQVVAHLWVAKPSHLANDLDRHGLERFAMAVALELAKQRNALQVRIGLSCDLVRDLLSDGVDQHETAYLQRAIALGHDLRQAHQVFLMRIDGDGSGRVYHDLLEVVDMVVRRSGIKVLIGGDAREVTLLRPVDENTNSPMAFAQLLVREFGRLNPRHSASVAIGEVARELRQLRRIHGSAQGALALSAGERTAVVVDVADLGVRSLLLSHGDPSALVAFADSLFAPIVQREPKRADELLETLQCWIDADCSSARAAEHLVVHSNTVLYRLKAIEEALGESIRTPAFLVKAELALTIRQVAGGRLRAGAVVAHKT